MSPWEVYFFGAFLAVLGTAIDYCFTKLVYYLSGQTVLWRNMKKIGLVPNNHGSYDWYTTSLNVGEARKVKTLVSFLLNILIAVLSWIGAIFAFVCLIHQFFLVIRNVIVSEPRKIQELRYPLRKSENLPPEIIWARSTAAAVLKGSSIDKIIAQLDKTVEESFAVAGSQKFDISQAIKELERLKIPEINAYLETTAGQIREKLQCY